MPLAECANFTKLVRTLQFSSVRFGLAGFAFGFGSGFWALRLLPLP